MNAERLLRSRLVRCGLLGMAVVMGIATPVIAGETGLDGFHLWRTSRREQGSPVAVGNTVVYRDGSMGDDHQYLRALDTSTSRITAFRTTGDSVEVSPLAFDGRTVAWMDDSGRTDRRCALFAYDTATRTTKTVAIVDGDEFGVAEVVLQVPALSGGRVAIVGKIGGVAGVWVADIATGARRKVSDTGRSVSLSGDWVVWFDRDDEDYTYSLKALNLSTGATRSLEIPDYAGGLDVDGSTVVFGSEGDIRSWDIVTGATSTLCSAPGIQLSPRVGGGYVVWEDARLSPEEDYFFEQGKALVYGVSLSGGPERLIAGAGSHSPRTDGASVSWVGPDDQARCATLRDRATTSLTLTGPRTVAFGATATLSGRLLDASGNGLGGRVVRLQIAPKVPFGTPQFTMSNVSPLGRTAEDGSFSFTVKPKVITRYRVDFVPPLDGSLQQSVSATLEVGPKPRVLIRAAGTARVRTPPSVTAFIGDGGGDWTEGAHDQPVLETYRLEGGRWVPGLRASRGRIRCS